MEDKTLKLFIDNYNNKGICEELPKYLKDFNKEYRKSNTSKTITYYPWAVVERFFRMQGGSIEVRDWATRVAFPFKDFAPDHNGELIMTDQEQYALFVHLVGTWQGIVEHEYYPIFDNQSSKIIKAPNSLDLNKARQRGMVRLIARLSGIGLNIFEQVENNLEEDDVFQNVADTTSIKVQPKAQPKVIKKAPKEETPTQEVSEETLNSKDFLHTFLSGDEVTPETMGIRQETREEFTPDTQEYADLLLEVRKAIRDNGKQQEAKEFVSNVGKELLSELTFSQLGELKNEIE
jgi:hypothetical protein